MGYFSCPGSGSGSSTDPIESESNPDQDPRDRKASFEDMENAEDGRERAFTDRGTKTKGVKTQRIESGENN